MRLCNSKDCYILFILKCVVKWKKLLSFVHEFLELCSSVYIFRKLISVAQEISIQGICLTASLCIYVINQKCPWIYRNVIVTDIPEQAHVLTPHFHMVLFCVHISVQYTKYDPSVQHKEMLFATDKTQPKNGRKIHFKCLSLSNLVKYVHGAMHGDKKVRSLVFQAWSQC